MSKTVIRTASSDDDLQAVRELFKEYADSLDFSLGFQGFEHELANLPGEYAPTGGTLLLGFVDQAAAGCVAVRKSSDGIAEMKRLWVRPSQRGNGLGRELIDHAVTFAREAGYRSIRLDSVGGKMDRAIALYRSLGFQEIPPYNDHPIPGTIYLELIL